MYLAIAFIMGGSSWASGPNLEKTVKKCAKLVSWDWGSLYEINKPISIHVYDITGCEDWYLDHWGSRDVFDKKTDEPVPMKIVETTVPPYKRGR